jgi:hypothetical protein
MMFRATRKSVLTAALILFAAAGLIFASAVGVGSLIRRGVITGLERRFESQVQVEALQVVIFPRIRVSAQGVVLRHKGRTDIPPLITMERLTLVAGLVDLLRTPRRLSNARIEGLHIRTPPKSPASSPKTASVRRDLPAIVIDEITAEDALLQTFPRDPRKLPRDFKIHRVVIRSFGFDRAASFRALLTNPKPIGEIDSEGQFGPWDAGEPGDTPVSGTFRFTDADFATLRGITGILSSEGKYSGALNRLDVEGQTHTPDFALVAVGNPVPLTVRYLAVVDGTNGNTYLTSLEAQLGASTILASGKVVGIPGTTGRHIVIEAASRKGQLEDLLRLTVKGPQPPMKGMVNFNATVELRPGQADILNRLLVNGRFSVAEGQFTDRDVQQKLDSLSRSGRGQPKNESIQDVISNLHARFVLRRGVASFSSLAFAVPGAEVELTGSYNLHTEEIDFHGRLLLDAKVSQTTTGARSFFLKLFDPFFAKDGAGASLPVRITGERSQPSLGLDLF